MKSFNQADYTDRAFVPPHPRYKRLWRLDDVFKALEQAGMRLREFREYPFSSYRHFPNMQLRKDNLWHLPSDRPQVPLLFSLKATRS